MSYQKFSKTELPVGTYTNIVYYGPIERNDEVDPILEQCEKTGGTGLIIDENTVYEVDCECYRQLLKRKERNSKNTHTS